jgi:hypothetical protein
MQRVGSRNGTFFHQNLMFSSENVTELLSTHDLISVRGLVVQLVISFSLGSVHEVRTLLCTIFFLLYFLSCG